MAERARRNLPYGHFGRAAYSLDDEEWHYDRHLSAPQSVWPLGSGQKSSQHNVHQPSTHDPVRKEPQARRFRRQIKALVQRMPEFQPAEHILSGLLRVSEAAQDALSKHDSMHGTLLSSTDIRSNASHKSIRIAALPAGETRSMLRLCQVQKQKRIWANDKKCWLDIPTLHGKEILLEENEGPIQQVTFAEPVDRGEPLLGVRLLRKTLIFRPTHGRNVHGTGATPSTSGMQANKLYSVDLDATGGFAHVDVAFNPWFSQQVAIVDQTGSWKVLEFQSRKLSQIARSWSGTIDRASPNDGWARIRWVLDPQTVAVCTRHSVTLFNIAGNQARHICSSAPEISSGAQWILDFAVLPGHLTRCVLLTSTHLTVLEVCSKGQQDVEVKTLLSVEHFRNPEETSMHMTLWSDDEDVCILIYTATSRSCPLYRIALSQDTQLRLYEPVEFRLFRDNASHIILDLSVSPIARTDKDRAISGERGSNARYVTVAMIMSNNTVVEEMMCWSSGGSNASPCLSTPGSKPKSTSTRTERARFVVDDDYDILREAVTTDSPVALHRARLRITRAQGPDRFVELDRLAQQLLRPPRDEQPLESLLDDVKSAFDTDENTVLPMRTLENLLPTDLDIEDVESFGVAIEGISKRLTEASEKAAQQRRPLQLSVLASPSVVDLATGPEHGSISTTYNNLVAGWIGSLSDDVSGRVRLAKVETARKIAAQLILASRIVRAHEAESPALSQGSNEVERVTAWELPDRTHGVSRANANSASLDVIRASQYSALPTPSPSATPSVASMSTGISGFAAPQIYPLSGYASFNKPSPSVLSRPMSKILSHWRLGESTMDYDWQSKSKHLQREEDDEEEEEMTEKERSRLQRRAERHIRRQRKEAEASQAQQMASSQAPEIMTASQPVPARIESQPVAASSQLSLPRTVATSQVTPGRYGGRPPKKKRKSGF
ncbi:putative RNA polymerase I-specific transcription initiation factor RRN6 [Septoria linicola]|nr:putative RNA polymerase I-specific transcription initiation factor RRN6 [Septoria linicola]